MPVYEYEHVFEECPIAGDVFEVIQGLDEAPLEHCPGCGLEVRRIVSRMSFNKAAPFSAGKAAKHGLTTWKRASTGVWEKLDGPGVDYIVGGDEAP